MEDASPLSTACKENSLKHWLWTIIIAIELIIAGLGVWLLVRHYEVAWFTAYIQCFDEGDDTSAREYAERLAWLDKKQSSFFLAQLDVARSIRLHGVEKHETLERARKKFDMTDFSGWPPGGRADVVLLKAYLDAALGREAQALDEVHHACEALRSPHESFEKCMQSIADGGSSLGERSGDLRWYEASMLALKIKLGDPTLLRFHIVQAMRSFDVDKAHEMRAAMAREGSLTQSMHKEYCDTARRLDESLCSNYLSKE